LELVRNENQRKTKNKKVPRYKPFLVHRWNYFREKNQRKTKNEKRATKNKKRKTKNEKRKRK
jgi:hypothetical protein